MRLKQQRKVKRTTYFVMYENKRIYRAKEKERKKGWKTNRVKEEKMTDTTIT